MLTALILIAAIAGILAVSRRWPDVEARLWPDEVDVPEAVAQSDPDAGEPAGEPTAGGLMRKKPLTTEPEGELASLGKPDFTETPAEEPATAPKPTGSDAAASPLAAAPQPAPTSTDRPAPRVMGEPARPSQPAYVDATKRMAESFEQLSAEADRAWHDRNYERAEQACLKILVQQPKNHKYMTRIGQIYQELGNLTDAKEAFEAAKKLDPKNFFVLNRLTEVERQLAEKAAKRPVARV